MVVIVRDSLAYFIHPEGNKCSLPCSQTTIIGVEFDGGVVLGSDSRVSAG